jgi:hypothetical protein
MTELVGRARLWETRLRETKPEVEPVLQSEMDAFQPQAWSDEGTLGDLLRTALRMNLATMLGEDGASDMVRAMNADDVMNQLEILLPKEETNGVAS